MEWEKKAEMVGLHNEAVLGHVDSFAAILYASQHVSEFDNQAWDMFSEVVELIPDKIKENIETHKKIYEKLKEYEIQLGVHGFRSAMRLQMYKDMLEKLTQKTNTNEPD